MILVWFNYIMQNVPEIKTSSDFFEILDHAALSSFQSSGRITRDIRFSPRLGLHPNFSSTSFQKNFVYPGRYAQLRGEA